MPNVKINFNYKLTGADFVKNKAWFEIMNDSKPSTGRNREVEIDFDFLIGADGAHSAARYHMMKFARLDYQQEYIDTLWCEFKIEAAEVAPQADTYSRFRISPNHLHIWPGKEFMFIAIPSFVRIFDFPQCHYIKKRLLIALPRMVLLHARFSFPLVTSLDLLLHLARRFLSSLIPISLVLRTLSVLLRLLRPSLQTPTYHSSQSNAHLITSRQQLLF